MPLSPEEKKTLEALMAKDQEPEADEEFDVVMEVDGKKVTMPYSRASKLLKTWGFDLETEMPLPEGEEGEGEEGEEIDPEGEVDPENPFGDGRPVPRKRQPAKKAAAKAVPEVDPNVPPEMRGKSYWKRPA